MWSQQHDFDEDPNAQIMGFDTLGQMWGQREAADDPNMAMAAQEPWDHKKQLDTHTLQAPAPMPMPSGSPVPEGKSLPGPNTQGLNPSPATTQGQQTKQTNPTQMTVALAEQTQQVGASLAQVDPMTVGIEQIKRADDQPLVELKAENPAEVISVNINININIKYIISLIHFRSVGITHGRAASGRRTSRR